MFGSARKLNGAVRKNGGILSKPAHFVSMIAIRFAYKTATLSPSVL
jgi:hypothetical protein